MASGSGLPPGTSEGNVILLISPDMVLHQSSSKVPPGFAVTLSFDMADHHPRTNMKEKPSLINVAQQNYGVDCIMPTQLSKIVESCMQPTYDFPLSPTLSHIHLFSWTYVWYTNIMAAHAVVPGSCVWFGLGYERTSANTKGGWWWFTPQEGARYTSRAEPFYVEFACSPGVRVGSLWLLPPSKDIHLGLD